MSFDLLYLHETFGPPHSWFASWNPFIINAAKTRHAERDTIRINSISNANYYNWTDKQHCSIKKSKDITNRFFWLDWLHDGSIDTCLKVDMQGHVMMHQGPHSHSEHLPSEPQGMSAFGFHVQTGEISGQEKGKNVWVTFFSPDDFKY